MVDAWLKNFILKKKYRPSAGLRDYFDMAR